MARNIRSAANAVAFLAGVTLLGGISSSAQSTNLISQTTFDPEAASPWGYGYFYGNRDGETELGSQEHNRAYYLPEDTEMTNAMWLYSFDLTDLAGRSGYGTGTGGPLFLTDPAAFVSGDRSNYILTFDARAEGLKAGQTSANAQMELQFYSPGETQPVKTIQVNLPFAPTAEWKTYSFTLNQGSLSGDSNEPMFETNHTATSELRFNINFHEPHPAFDYDAGNALYLDNVKLEVVAVPTAPPVETTPVTMAEWNFDDKTVWYEYHYGWVAEQGEPLVVTAGNNANGTLTNELGTDASSAWFLNIDNSAYASTTVPAWAGAGTGGGGPIDLELLDSGKLADYRVTFDARVLGLAPERTTGTSGLLQFFLDTPDDTLQPADENTDGDVAVQLNFPIPALNADWQTYSFLLSKGNVGTGSEAQFAQLLDAITGMRTQWQIENAADAAVWGYDAENTLVIDNFKLERLYAAEAGGPRLNVAHENGRLILTWNTPAGSNFKLQSATSVDGPYTDVAGASSGYSVETSGTAQFFRLVQSTN